MELKVVKSDGTYTHAALVGKMDVAGVQAIEGEFIRLVAAAGKNAVVDISKVSFMGSMGLRVFLSAAKSLGREKKSLILLNPQPLVNDVLEASSFHEVVAIEHDVEAAIKKARG